MLSREPVDIQQVTYSIVGLFLINYIMLNRKNGTGYQRVMYYRFSRSVTC
jgi:hypothetical protein